MRTKINFDRRELYMDTDKQAVLCVPYQEKPVIYADLHQIIIAPKRAVEDICAEGDTFTKFAYRAKNSKQSWLSECDENTRELVKQFHEDVIIELNRRRQMEIN